MTLFRKQLLAGLGALPAAAMIFLVWRYTPELFSSVTLPADDSASRLQFVVQWLLVPGLTLLAGIVGAARRGFFADAIEGTRTPTSHSLEINLRYNINTAEQTVLAIIAWTGVALAVPHQRLDLIPAMAFLFGFGRISFWIGYLLHPLARAFGMTLTAVPTLLAYTWLVAQRLH